MSFIKDQLEKAGLPVTDDLLVDNILGRFRLGGTSEQGWNRVNTVFGILPARKPSGEPSLQTLRRAARDLRQSTLPDSIENYRLGQLINVTTMTIRYRTRKSR